VYALGKASGCHINPAVTLGLCAAGRFERFLVLPYIGGVIGLEALFAGPISGASMNPARSLAPAVVMMHFDHVWIYIVAPIAGALASVPLYYCIHSSPYCSSGDIGECS
jgi:aquaporin Z